MHHYRQSCDVQKSEDPENTYGEHAVFHSRAINSITSCNDLSIQSLYFTARYTLGHSQGTPAPATLAFVP